MGPQKVLLVLGVQVDKLENGCIPSFKSAEPLVMKIVENCPGETIEEVILEAKEKVGDVYGVVSDAGAEMKKGMKLLFESGQNTVHVFDIVHLISNLLKNELNNDSDWLTYKQECTHMIQVIKLSDLAHLAPPRQRSKARLMASTTILEWGHKFLTYVDSLSAQEEDIDLKLMWILKFRKQLDTWSQLLNLGKSAIDLVHKQGYHNQISLEWDKIVSSIPLNNLRTKAFAESIKATLRKEGSKIAEGERCLGSSVVIESAFGKFKQLEGYHASSGITSLVLALPAIFGETDDTELANALHNISVNELSIWLEENLGETYRSKRIEALKDTKQNEAHENTHTDLESCEYLIYKQHRVYTPTWGYVLSPLSRLTKLN